jgi:hypothetical protein
MKKIIYLLLGAFAAVAIASCSSDDDDPQTIDGPDFSISELQGNWTATAMGFSYSSLNNVPDPDFADIIGEGGSGSMSVQSNGQFTLTIDPFDRPAFTIRGRMFFEDGEFFAIQFEDDPSGDYEYFGATLTGNTFQILGGPGTAEYDLDLDGEDDPCSVSMQFVRS